MKSAITLETPLDESSVRGLAAGEAVTLNGTVFTARDRFHRHAAGGGAYSFDARGGILFHCGPVVTGPPGRQRVLAAGPTTSMREEPYMAAVIERLGIRAIVGKGGMGPSTLEACAGYGCVYIQTVGGAAQYLGRCVRSIQAVYHLSDFGPVEAVWELSVLGLPGIVTMDTRGVNLYDRVSSWSHRRWRSLLQT